MPQKSLKNKDVSPVAEELNRHRVSEAMRPTRAYTRHLGEPTKHLGNHLAMQAPTALIQKERVFWPTIFPDSQILPQRFLGPLANIDNPPVSLLGRAKWDYNNLAAETIVVPNTHPAELANPQAGVQECQNNGDVTFALRPPEGISGPPDRFNANLLRRSQQLADFILGEGLDSTVTRALYGWNCLVWSPGAYF